MPFGVSALFWPSLILLAFLSALQDAKFAVVLEEDLDISVDFFR